MLNGNIPIFKFFGNDGEGGTSGFSNTQCQMPGFPPHGYHKIPPGSGLSIDHQIFNNLYTHVPRSLIPKGRDTMGKIQVIINGFRYMNNPNAATGFFFHLHGTVSRIVAPDGNQFVHI